MLIVDVNTLHTVGSLNLADEVIVNSLDAENCENIMRVESTFGDGVALVDVIAGLNLDAHPVVDGIRLLLEGLGICDDDVSDLLDLALGNRTGDLTDKSEALGLSRFEQLLDSGKTFRDIGLVFRAAGVERSHRQLCTGLAYRLSRDDTDCFTDRNRLAGCKVRAVALDADAVLGLAGKQRTDLYLCKAVLGLFARGDLLIVVLIYLVGDALCVILAHHLILAHDKLAGILIDKVVEQIAAGKTLGEADYAALSVEDIVDIRALCAAAVLLADDNILRDIDKTSGKVTRVRGTKCGIGKTFTRTTRRDEVFEYIKTFTVVGSDGDFNRLTCRIRDKSAHTCKLTQLAVIASRTGVKHHVDRVVGIEVRLEFCGNSLCAVFPGLNDHVRALLIGEKTVLIVVHDLGDVLLGVGNEFALTRRYGSVADSDGDTASGRVLVALSLNLIKHIGCYRGAVNLDASIDNFAEFLFIDEEIDLKLEVVLRIASVNKAEILRDRSVEDNASHGGGDELSDGFAVYLLGHADFDSRMESDGAVVVSHGGLIDISEHLALAGLTGLFKGEVIGAEDHVLRGNGDRASVGGLEEVVGGEHKEARLSLSLRRKRNVNCHLVAVEVGVECGTNEGMKLDSSALDKDGLESLDTESVKRGSAVKEHGVILDNHFESIPDNGILTLDHLSCGLDVVRLAGLDKSLHNEGLEQLKSHLGRQTALIDLQLGTDDDNRTSGIVNTLTEQVLSETSLLTFKHIGERLERSVVRTGYGSAAAAVVDKSIDSFLKHTLLVADYYLGRAELKELAQTVVSVDNAAVKIVEVARCKASALELNHGTKLRRDNRKHVEDHPLGSVAALSERLDNLKAFESLSLLLTACFLYLLAQLRGELVEVDLGKKLLDSLGAHACPEIVLIHQAILVVILLVENLILFKIRCAGIDNDMHRKVENFLKVARRYIEDKTHS